MKRAFDCVDYSLANGKAFNSLSSPLGLYSVARDAPHFFRIVFKKDEVKLPAKPVNEKFFKGLFGLDRKYSDFDVAQSDPDDPHQPEVLKRAPF